MKRFHKFIISVFVIALFVILFSVIYYNVTGIDYVSDFGGILFKFGVYSNDANFNTDNSKELLGKTNEYIKNNYIGHYLTTSGYTDGSSSNSAIIKFRHIWCLDWRNDWTGKDYRPWYSNTSSRWIHNNYESWLNDYSDYRIVDVINLGFKDSDVEIKTENDQIIKKRVYELQNPNYAYSVHNSKGIFTEGNSTAFMANCAYRTNSGNQTTFAYYMQWWLNEAGKNIMNETDLDAFNNNMIYYQATANNGYQGSKSIVAQSSANQSWCYDTFFYTRNIKAGKEEIKIISNDEYLKNDKTNVENYNSAYYVGPIKLSFYDGEFYNQNTKVTTRATFECSNQGKGYYKKVNNKFINDEDGKISDGEEFYIKFDNASDIPDTIKFSIKYDQFVGRVILVYGGEMQTRCIATGDKESHPSSVTFEIEKGADLSLDTYIDRVRAVNGTVENYIENNKATRSGKSNGDKEKDPVYVETGDMLSVIFKEDNKRSVDVTLKRADSTFDSNLSFMNRDEVYDYTHSDENKYLNVFWNKDGSVYKYENTEDTGWGIFNSKTKSRSQNLKLKVNAAQNTSVGTVTFNIDGSIGPANDTNYVEDTSGNGDINDKNNNSSDYVQLKSIDANISKAVKSTSSKYKDENGRWLVEEGDKVTYTITVSNPGANDGTASTLYNVKVIDELPDGLELDKDSFEVGSNTYSFINQSNTKEDKTYGYIDGNKLVFNIASLSTNESASTVITVYCKVTAHASHTEEIPLTNTSSIKSFENRNKIQFDPEKKATATIYVKPIDGTIEKTVKGNTTVEYGDIVTYSIKVSNPIPDGKNANKISTLKNVKVTDTIPEGLELASNNFYFKGPGSTREYSRKFGANNTNPRGDIKNGNDLTFYIDSINPGESYEILIECKVTSFGQEEGLKTITNTAILEEYQNRNDITYTDGEKSSVDIYVKSYRINVNKYLSKVSYGTNGTEIPDPSREAFSEDEKYDNPYHVEYGDILEYKLIIKNTGDVDLYNLQFFDLYDKTMLKYLGKDNEIEDNKYFNANLTLSTLGDHFYLPSGKLEAGKTFTLVLRYQVMKTLEYDDIVDIFNTMYLTYIKNKNNEVILNRTVYDYRDGSDGTVHIFGNLESSEHVREKTYGLTTNKYISGYDEKVMKENIENGLITIEDETEDYYEGNYTSFIQNRKNLSNQEKFNKPFAVEKSETVTYTVRIENQKSEDEKNNAIMYIDQVYDFMSDGLSIQKDTVKINVKQSDFKQLQAGDYTVTVNSIEDGEDRITIQFNTETIKTENGSTKQVIALEPGDYIEITYDVLVTESNMTLEKIMNTAYVREAFNRNSKVIFELSESGKSGSGTVIIDGGNGSGGIIKTDTGLNTSSIITIEVVKLKEIVVAGFVWNDTNPDGIKHRSESGIEDILVTLNGLTEDSKENRYIQVTTKDKGLYTFGRIFRTDKFGEYEKSMYISYTYNGVKYQSTVYSGIDNLSNPYEEWLIGEDGKYKVDSNAKEFMNSGDGFTGRIDFNDELKTISYNYATPDATTRNPDDSDNLEYDKKGTESIINIDGSSKFINSYSFIMPEEVQKYDENGNPFTEIQEYVEPLWFEDVRSKKYDTEYLKYINLGLISRDQLDLSIAEKLESVQTTIFGDQLKYLYDEDDKPEFQFYEGDYEYEYKDYLTDAVRDYLTANSELTTEVTYKVTLTNGNEENLINDANVAVEVNELALYLDDKYITYKNSHNDLRTFLIAKKENEDGLFEDIQISAVEAYYYDNNGNRVNLSVSPRTSNYNPLEQRVNPNEDYTRLYITPSSYSETGIVIPNSVYDDVAGKRVPGTFDIYLKFTDANRSEGTQVGTDFLDPTHIELNQKYNNVVEISAYSTYYKENKDFGFGAAKAPQLAGHGAGFIDVDSNPGNIGLTDSGEFINFFVTDESEGGISAYRDYAEDDTCRGEILFKGKPTPPDDSTGTGTGTGGGTGSGTGTGDGTGTGTGGYTPLLRTIEGIVFEDARSEAAMDKVTGNETKPYSTLYITDDERGNVFDAINKDVTADDYGVDSNGNVYKNVQYIGNGLYNYTQETINGIKVRSGDTALENARRNKVTMGGHWSSRAGPLGVNFVDNENFGKYDYLLSGINVKLMKTIKLAEDEYYEVDLSNENEYKQEKVSDERKVSTVTSSGNSGNTKGEYSLDVSTPGTYYVRFCYGDGTWAGLGEDVINPIIYNGQDYKSTTLANYNEYLSAENLRTSNSRALSNDGRKKLEESWIIGILDRWLVNYYNYSSTEEWYRAMLAEYNEMYHFLEGKTGNSFIALPSYYKEAHGDDYDYMTDCTYIFIMETIFKDIGKNPNSNDLSIKSTFPWKYGETTGGQRTITPYTLMQWLLPKDKLEKVFRNVMINYIQKEGSVAMDDARQRMIILERSQNMSNTTAEVLSSLVKYISNYDATTNMQVTNQKIIDEYKEILDIFTKYSYMFADSSEFYLRTEKIYYDYNQMDENEIQYMKYKDRFDIDEAGNKISKYNVENIDCGLQYRPETELRLKEYVKQIKVVKSSGEEWINIQFNEDKTIKQEYENKGLSNMMRVESIRIDDPETGGYTYQKGFEFINVDEIYLQGSTLYIDYGIYVDNTSEIDRIGYYLQDKYGRTEEHVKDALFYYNTGFYNDETEYYFVKEFFNRLKDFEADYTNFYDWYDNFMKHLLQELYIGSYKDFNVIYDWDKYKTEINSMNNEIWMLKDFLQGSIRLAEKSVHIIQERSDNGSDWQQVLKEFNISNENRIYVNDILRSILKDSEPQYQNPKMEISENAANKAFGMIIENAQNLEEITSNLRTKEKDRYYYSKYLSENFYGGTGVGNIVGVKINQIVSDIDSEIMVDESEISEEWATNEMNDLIYNYDAYLLLQDYNLNQDEINYDTELLSGVADGEFKDFAIDVLSSVITTTKLYSVYENLYNDKAFNAWYDKSLSFIYNTTKENAMQMKGVQENYFTGNIANELKEIIQDKYGKYKDVIFNNINIIDKDRGIENINGYAGLYAYFRYKANNCEDYEDKMRYSVISELMNVLYFFNISSNTSENIKLFTIFEDAQLYTNLIAYSKEMTIDEYFNANSENQYISNLAYIQKTGFSFSTENFIQASLWTSTSKDYFETTYSNGIKRIISVNLPQFLMDNAKFEYNRAIEEKDNVPIKKVVSIEQSTKGRNKTATYEDYNTLGNIIFPNQTYDRVGNQYIDTYVRDENGNIQKDENGEDMMNIPKDTRVSTSLLTQKEISGDILKHADLKFNNYSEILSYTASNGRRTAYALTVGNGIHGEVDDDESVEYVTFSNPTGLPIYQQKLRKVRTGMIYAVIVGISILVISGIGMLIANKKGKKKYWR